MTRCAQCGREIPAEFPAGAAFCPFCGARLQAAAAGPGTPSGADSTSTMAAVSGASIAAPEDVVADLTPDDQAAVEALPAGSALLLVLRGPNAGSRFLLDTEMVTAGRHPESDIFLDDVTVSRRHAEFVRTGTGYAVRDVGSLNGTYVNRDRIDEVALSNGDEVQVGKFRLVYYAATAGLTA